jgi:hypothetical protein
MRSRKQSAVPCKLHRWGHSLGRLGSRRNRPRRACFAHRTEQNDSGSNAEQQDCRDKPCSVTRYPLPHRGPTIVRLFIAILWRHRPYNACIARRNRLLDHSHSRHPATSIRKTFHGPVLWMIHFKKFDSSDSQTPDSVFLRQTLTRYSILGKDHRETSKECGIIRHSHLHPIRKTHHSHPPLAIVKPTRPLTIVQEGKREWHLERLNNPHSRRPKALTSLIFFAVQRLTLENFMTTRPDALVPRVNASLFTAIASRRVGDVMPRAAHAPGAKTPLRKVGSTVRAPRPFVAFLPGIRELSTLRE